MNDADRNPAQELPERPFDEMLQAVLASDDLSVVQTPLARITRDFFQYNWIYCRDGLLAKTRRIRVEPLGLPAPRVFKFEIDTPFKRRREDGSLELEPGPVRGTIYYRPDLMVNPDSPAIAVTLDRELGFFHPNFSRKHSAACLGDLPGGPYPLDALLEDHVFPILSYQNRRPSHPADVEAARYFALDPQAMVGLDRVEPLY